MNVLAGTPPSAQTTASRHFRQRYSPFIANHYFFPLYKNGAPLDDARISPPQTPNKVHHHNKQQQQQQQQQQCRWMAAAVAMLMVMVKFHEG
jgi:hypothetical protein